MNAGGSKVGIEFLGNIFPDFNSVKLNSVHYESSSSSSSSEEEEEEESDKEEEEPKKCTRTNCKNNCKICTMKKINDNMKAQPEYEVIYNNKLLRSHQTNILKVGFNMSF